ncbi:MAG: EF-hand domain-containing protein [Opitutaceae bacterium]
MKIKSTLLSLAAIAIIPAFAQAKPSGQGQDGQRPNPAELFKRLDADSSGGISKEEAKGPLAKHFESADKNGDGEISQGEFAAAGQKARKNRKGGDDRGDRFEEMDADQSGGISREEAGERLLEHFDKIDADGSGEITKEELKAAGDKRRAKKEGDGQTV